MQLKGGYSILMKNKIKLFCIPYAGGSASTYVKWREFLDENIELGFIELAGRGSRFKTKPYECFEQAVNDIARIIKSQTEQAGYCIYGHSLGSLLAFETAHKLIESNSIPMHIFFSGMHPPYTKKATISSLHTLPDANFMEEIYKLGGTPKEVMENSMLLDLFIPLLKSDYRLFEEYKYVEKKEKLNMDITIFTGKQDGKVNQYDVLKWGDFTTGNCEIESYEGGHFFVNDWTEEIVNKINHVVLSGLKVVG